MVKMVLTLQIRPFGQDTCCSADEQEFMKSAFKCGYKNITKTKAFKDAVKMAVKKTSLGGTLLFSPACSSFDQFSSYLERGNEFNKIIKELEPI